MKIWLRRRGNDVQILIQGKMEKYFEASSLWFIHCCRRKWKKKMIRLIDINSPDPEVKWSRKGSLTIHTNFPPQYKRSYQKGWYIEGDRIYYHQVREIMVRIYKKK